MADKINSFDRFWKELKRRKVFGVITTYAATAYIIIEVTNNLIAPLHLPDWIATIVVLILATGFPVVVILSWIFDFTPQGIKKTEPLTEPGSEEVKVRPAGKKLRASYLLNAVLLIIVLILAYPKLFKHNTLENLREKGRISVAVMPFQNKTSDTVWNVWQDGIQLNLITSLSNSTELKVRQAETVNNYLQGKGIVNYGSFSSSITRAISRNLETSVVVSGTINKAGDKVRIISHLIDSENNDVIRSFQIESPLDESQVFEIIDSLSRQISNYLLLTKLLRESPRRHEFVSKTCTPEAYRFFMHGQRAFNRMDYPEARELYLKAIALDSNFYAAIKMLSCAYRNQFIYKQAREWCLTAYKKRDQMPLALNININWLHALLFETPVEEIKYLNQLLELDDQNPMIYYELGRVYVALDQYDKAIQVLEKDLKIYEKWGSRPRWVNDYIMLGYSYQESGQYKKEKKLFRKAAKDFPDDPELIYRQAVLALSVKDTVEANHFIDRYISLMRGNLASEADIGFSIGDIYLDADLHMQGAKIIHEALMLDPDNPFRMNFLAYTLIENEINISEGVDLISKALKIVPDNYNFLHTLGWGLFKQGKYQESLEILRKSWDLRRQFAEYDYTAFLHLEAAQKAVAGIK